MTLKEQIDAIKLKWDLMNIKYLACTKYLDVFNGLRYIEPRIGFKIFYYEDLMNSLYKLDKNEVFDICLVNDGVMSISIRRPGEFPKVKILTEESIQYVKKYALDMLDFLKE